MAKQILIGATFTVNACIQCIHLLKIVQICKMGKKLSLSLVGLKLIILACCEEGNNIGPIYKGYLWLIYLLFGLFI